MEPRFAKFLHIDHEEPITFQTHYDFLYHLQRAVLHALREQGRLNPMQHRYAEEKLNQQRRERAKNILKTGQKQ